MISIPTGTIKSKFRNCGGTWFRRFQFLLVRLKDDSDITIELLERHFNSYWYD